MEEVTEKHLFVSQPVVLPIYGLPVLLLFAPVAYETCSIVSHCFIIYVSKLFLEVRDQNSS